ncbi:MAG: HD domain-containing protein [Cyanobacteria bacterium]|nr:HD domain-containing protein [Cyanobacteriota bacterium]
MPQTAIIQTAQTTSLQFEQLGDLMSQPNAGLSSQPNPNNSTNPSDAGLNINELMRLASFATDLLEGRPIGHGMRVAVIAGRTAQQLGLPVREVTSITYAGLLHDVGLASVATGVYGELRTYNNALSEKQVLYHHTLLNGRVMQLPDAVQLPPSAEDILKAHTHHAGQFIGAWALSQDVQEIILAHHELCDGSGYPYGLSREAIPLGARILAFADTIEAVIAEAPTGLATRWSGVENFIEVKVAHTFDPEVVSAFKVLAFQEHEMDSTDFLPGLLSRDVLMNSLTTLLPQRTSIAPAQQVLPVLQAIGRLSDQLMPGCTDHQSLQVARISLVLADRLGIQSAQRGELVTAAMLLSLGKLSLPLSILWHPGALTAPEWQQVQAYPRESARLLSTVPSFSQLSQWTGDHQERLNGTGYPNHRKGFDISIASRILGLSNAFVGLTSPRPFRSHFYDPLDALPILGQGRHRLFDDHLVSLLRTVVLEQPIAGPV